MVKTKIIFGVTALAAALTLTACANDSEEKTSDNNMNMNSSSEHSKGEHMHTDSDEVPSNLKSAENPTHEIGSKAIIQTDHMEGMKDAEATIVGAYDTIAYVVSYLPTTGGETIDNHKWVIQEEIKDAGDKILEAGTEVIIEADHMKGMKGAAATIDSAEQTTVYMIDYKPITGGKKVTNHKWIAESELN